MASQLENSKTVKRINDMIIKMIKIFNQGKKKLYDFFEEGLKIYQQSEFRRG